MCVSGNCPYATNALERETLKNAGAVSILGYIEKRDGLSIPREPQQIKKITDPEKRKKRSKC